MLAHPHIAGIGLRNVEISAQPVSLCDAIEQRAAFVHQRPHVDVALRDHTGKRRPHRQVILQIVDPRQVGFQCRRAAARRVHRFLQGLYVGLLGRILHLRGVVVLPRDHVLNEKLLLAVGGHFGQRCVAAPLFESRLSLLDVAVRLV